MQYLQSKNIVHRDLALRNLLVSIDGQDGTYLVKVAGMGIELS